MTKIITIAASIALLAACESPDNGGSLPANDSIGLSSTGGSANAVQDVDGSSSSTGGQGDATVDAGPAPASPDAGVSPCEAKGGQLVTTSFVSYGYYDTADGLIKCDNYQFDAPQKVCIYSNSANQVSTTNLCANLSPASSCTYKTPITFGGMNTTGTETDYYTVISHPNLSDWQESCKIIGGTWKTQ